MKGKRLKCIIFDMDGTLVDSESIYIEGYKRAFREKDIPIEECVIRSWAGQSAHDTLSQIDGFTHDRKLSEELRQMRLQYFADALSAGNVQLQNHAREVIAFCKSKDFKIGLATSTFSDWAIPILEKLALNHSFDFVVFGDEVKTCKPAPDIYHLAIERSGIDKDECLVLEDSKSGITAAIGADLRVVYIPDPHVKKVLTHPKIFKTVETLKHVIAIIEELL